MAKTLVFGHKNPDTDTIASAIAASYFLNQIGEDTEAVAQGTPNAETQFAFGLLQGCCTAGGDVSGHRYSRLG